MVDAANVAALAALMSFRRPECSVGGQDGQEITIHPPEVGLLYINHFVMA
jgi:exosome complex component RRP45